MKEPEVAVAGLDRIPVQVVHTRWRSSNCCYSNERPACRDIGRAFNFAVDDMDAIFARLTAHGVPIIKRDDDDTFGRFAWIQDPDGTKIELWQPKRSVSTHGSA